MSIRKTIPAVLLALSCLVSAPATSSQEVEKRDLSGYEKEEEFFLRHWYGEMLDDEEGAKARVREFVWERWRAKKSAYCSIRVGYTHGDSMTTNYYVEPDKEGRWRVVVETVSNSGALESLSAAMRGEQKEMERETRIMGSYYIVSRVDAASGEPVKEKERRKPETYTLLLQDGRSKATDETGLSAARKL